jgi:outer membrane lipoprotein
MPHAVLVIFLLLVPGCARPPIQLRSDDVAPLSVREVQQKELRGVRVRWGGTIVRAQIAASESCFEVLARPVDREARPRRTDDADGRFLVCHSGFFDPEVYGKGREITAVGTVIDIVEEKVGEYPYRFPKLAAEVIHLWPQRVDPPPVYYYGWPYYWDPWIWGPPTYPRYRPPRRR